MTLKAVAGGGGGAASGITIGTSVITGGTNTRVLFDDSGVVGESAGLTYVKASGTLTATFLTAGGVTLGQVVATVPGVYFSSYAMYQFGGRLFISDNTTATNITAWKTSAPFGQTFDHNATLGWSNTTPDGVQTAFFSYVSAGIASFDTTTKGDGLGQLNLTNLAAAGAVTWGGQSRVATQFDTTSATLANVTGLSVNVLAGKTYHFEGYLPVTVDAVGGQQYAIAGTATATAIISDIEILDETTGLTTTTRATALASAASLAGNTHTAFLATVRGTITVNAGGTLTLQAAENSASGTLSILRGSSFFVWQF